MAKLEITWDDDFEQLLKRAANFDDIAPKMIDSATPHLEKSIKKRLERHRETGELIKSIEAKKASRLRNGGYYGYVTATGVAKGRVYKRARKNGGYSVENYRNYQKMLALEFGTSKQSPTPFLQSAVNDVETACLNAMQNTFNREMEQ